MKKIFFFILILEIFVATNFVATEVFAQTNTFEYTVLAPLPGTTVARCDPGTPDDPACKTTLQRYLPGVFNLAIGISAVFAVLMIVIGGFQYMSSDAIMGKKDGKERVKNAVLGLVFVISAWLILYTINPKLLELNLNISPVPTTQTTGGGSLTRAANGDDLLSGASLQADQNIRNQLANDGVTVNNPPCTSQRTSNCTNLDGLPQQMVMSLIALRNSCSVASRPPSPCVVQVTGGTESSLHTTGTAHGNNSSVVDLASTASLNRYLGVTNPVSGSRVTMGGLTFTYEVVGDSGGVSTGNHWHVTR